MATKKIPEVVLNSGKKMPTIEFGTGTTPPPQQTLLDAIEIGYRHFDTSALYNTEEPLGQTVSKALELGLVKNRDELFITSKLWCTDAHHDLVLPALKTTVKKLGLEYVDLYLIHWPMRLKQDVKGLNFKSEDIITFEHAKLWKIVIDWAQPSLLLLSTILENAKIPPVVNQVV
ncbi:methylecgonone reductase [Trifolium repens]|nr:methylecgonone reductase [Trifolium repens]